MDNKDIFKNIYNDFFGTDKIKQENEKLAQELHLNEDFPVIEVKNDDETESNNISNEILDAIDNRIDNLYITEDSKNTLKKMIQYIKKYCEKIEKTYIPFNLCIYSDNKETVFEITDIISYVAANCSYIKKGEIVEASMYNIDKIDRLEDIYNSRNAVVLFNKFEAFISQNQDFKNKFWHKVSEKINDNKNQFLTVINIKSKELANQIFENNEDIKQNMFDFEIVGIKPDIQDVYQEVKKRLSENNEITEEFEIKLLDYISVTYPNSNFPFPEYRDKLCEKILFSKIEKITVEDLPDYEKEKSIEEIFAELNDLVGLSKVKKVLQDLVSLIELKNKTKDDLKIKDTNLHMVFLGNPGTGKTTVARIIAQILYNLKYIKQNKLIEVSSKDLVAEYVGQTAPKTMAVVEKAMGGVLFIDEAYSLASGNGQGNSYNEEAVATLIQAMENHRDNLVVIFAGYTKEMQDFLNLNSGIVSRIGYTLEFEDYSEKELLQIFKSMMKKSGFIVTAEALDEVLKIIREYKDSKNFGNARFVRNVYEKTIIKHASNTKGKKSKKILKTIEKEDISAENLLK